MRASWQAGAVGAIAALALALRLPGLASRSLWLDEAWRANIALAPSWAAFSNEVLGGGAPGSIGAPLPPLFALLLRGLALLVGHSEGGLRALPLAASVLAVPLAFLVARRWFGPTAGIAVALCFACYPAAVFHGQELKQYSLDVLVVLVLLHLAGLVAERPDSWWRWAYLTLAAVLAPGVSYPAALVLPGVALGLVAVCRRARHLLAWVAAHAIAAGAALTWYLGVIGPQRARPQVVAYWAADFAPPGAGPATEWAGAQLLALTAYAFGRPALLFALVVLIGLVLAPRWGKLTTVGSALTVLTAAALHLYPLAAGRTSLFLLPFLYLPLAGALARLGALGGTAGAKQRAIRTIAIGGALVLLALPARGALRAGLVMEETAPLVRRLAADRQPTDRVYVYCGAVPAFHFYHSRMDERVTLGGSHRDESAAYGAELRPILVPGERLWLLFAHVVPARDGGSERDVILGELRLYGRQLGAWETEGASLHLFEITRAPGTVRHIRIRPEDLRDPERMRELLGR